MENFECSICYEKFDEPVECLNCNNNFCKKHVKGFKNGCPLCKNKPFEYRENIWLSRTISNMDFSYKCTECGYEGDQNSFWSHLIESHKKEIINKFNEYKESEPKEDNNNRNISKKEITLSKIPFSESLEIPEDFDDQNNNNNIGQKIDNYNLFNNNIEKNNNKNINYPENSNINLQQIKMKPIIIKKKEEEILQNTHRNFQPKNYNHIVKNQKIDNKEFIPNPLSCDRNIIDYCGKPNELITCNCCPDHICKPGNCLCVNCMRRNINKFNLQNGELINRAGKIAKLCKGNYFCGAEYDKIIKNIVGIEFKKHSKCKLPFDSCDDCKVLNKFKLLYYGKKK